MAMATWGSHYHHGMAKPPESNKKSAPLWHLRHYVHRHFKDLFQIWIGVSRFHSGIRNWIPYAAPTAGKVNDPFDCLDM